MNSLISFITENSSFVYFVLGSVLSTFVTSLYFRYSINGKIAYHARTEVIIDKESNNIPSTLNLSIGDTLFNKLCRTTIYIWNYGRKTIRKGDFVQENPLRICFSQNLNPYYIEKVKSTDPSSTLEVIPKNNSEIELVFNYLEKKQGYKIDITHGDDKAIASVKGKVIDVTEIMESKNLINNRIQSLYDVWARICMYIVVCSLTIVLLFLIYSLGNNLLNEQWVSFVGLFFIPLFPSLLTPKLLKYFEKSKSYPKKLDDVN